jgi:hypothetical protein
MGSRRYPFLLTGTLKEHFAGSVDMAKRRAELLIGRAGAVFGLRGFEGKPHQQRKTF